MIRHEEVALLEQMIRHASAEKIQDVGALKQAIRDGLTDFEEVLKPLPLLDRQAALSLFLERIRETALGFHLAVLKLIAKDELRENPSAAKVQELGKRCEADMERIARLYKLL